MKLHVSAFLSGAIFGLGLAVSHMTDPAKVRGFLDVFGSWDPSLAVVLVVAVTTAALGFALLRRAPKPAFDAEFETIAEKKIGTRLLVGAGLFGIGWGLAGYCPGPGIVSLARFAPDAIVFVVAFVVGSAVAGIFMRTRDPVHAAYRVAPGIE